MANISSNSWRVLLTPEVVGQVVVSILIDKGYQVGLTFGFSEKGLLKLLNLPAALVR